MGAAARLYNKALKAERLVGDGCIAGLPLTNVEVKERVLQRCQKDEAEAASWMGN